MQRVGKGHTRWRQRGVHSQDAYGVGQGDKGGGVTADNTSTRCTKKRVPRTQQELAGVAQDGGDGLKVRLLVLTTARVMFTGSQGAVVCGIQRVAAAGRQQRGAHHAPVSVTEWVQEGVWPPVTAAAATAAARRHGR